MSEVSYSYPCIYGLRERCEAVELAFRLLSGELRRQLDLLLKIGEEEPRSDEERVVARMMKAVEGFLPKYFAGSYDEVIRELIRRAEDPKTALESLAGWMLDVRNDVKTLIQLLDEFCNILCDIAGKRRLRRVVKEVEEVKS